MPSAPYVYVLVDRAVGVLAADHFGTSDCFCEVGLDTNPPDEKKVTRVVDESTTPVWDCLMTFEMPKPHELPADRRVFVTAEVYDKDWVGKEFLGYVTVDVSHLKPGQVRGGDALRIWCTNSLGKGLEVGIVAVRKFLA
jgi:hypothetical protein